MLKFTKRNKNVLANHEKLLLLGPLHAEWMEDQSHFEPINGEVLFV
jgi:hypothetical protein